MEPFDNCSYVVECTPDGTYYAYLLDYRRFLRRSQFRLLSGRLCLTLDVLYISSIENSLSLGPCPCDTEVAFLSHQFWE